MSLPAPAAARGDVVTSEAGAALTACLLTYNHVGVVGSTLDSVLDQTLAGFELIVSDDCSTDGTWELISARAARDGRIVAVQTPRNLGMAGNANFAASHSRRPYLALLHHDDLYRRGGHYRTLSDLHFHNGANPGSLTEAFAETSGGRGGAG